MILRNWNKGEGFVELTNNKDEIHALSNDILKLANHLDYYSRMGFYGEIELDKNASRALRMAKKQSLKGGITFKQIKNNIRHNEFLAGGKRDCDQVGSGFNHFNFIIDPNTNKKFSIFSRNGKNVLKNLIKDFMTQQGGESDIANETDVNNFMNQ